MISIIGAGRSSLFLIEYLAKYCEVNQLKLCVCDKEITDTVREVQEKFTLEFRSLNLDNEFELDQLVSSSELVVSMLPAFLHIQVAKCCLKHAVHMATASYVSPEMGELHEEVKSKKLVFLNEMGLDPGIDHMSAMAIMDVLKSKGNEITSFKSYCGGLIADEDDGDNPWKYKFSWNPRNVVLAAQGAPARFLQNDRLKVLPYQRIFKESESIDVNGYGPLDVYPNRDSGKYQSLYGLDKVHTLIRGTFRKSGFCKAWHVIVNLGLTDDVSPINLSENATVSDWIGLYVPVAPSEFEQWFRLEMSCGDDDIEKLKYLGFFSQDTLPLCKGSSAQILEELLKIKWKLNEHDKDLVVMMHSIEYKEDGKTHVHESVMITEGESSVRTAMAKTVGLPLAIACRLLLENRIQQVGVLTPMHKEIYEPVLEELSQFGLTFKDRVMAVN